MSGGPDEGLTLCNNLVTSSTETGEKECRVVSQGTPMEGQFDDGGMFALISLTLSTKQSRKLFQSVSDTTGTFEVVGETIEFIVSNKTFEFPFLDEIMLAK